MYKLAETGASCISRADRDVCVIAETGVGCIGLTVNRVSMARGWGATEISLATAQWRH